ERLEEQEIRRIYRLSQRSYGVTVVLGLLVPIGAYIYTRRWRAMFIFLALLGFLAFVFAPEEESENWEPSPGLIAVATIVAVIDNVQAIRWAKKQMESNSN
ncbi:MAG: hypothetical protein NZL92_12210, partial [Gloeomargarita sp. SKYG116]|nr:hypothetical protein [Gloeomargarita sp. SKYG116]MDW8402443.1 hypothetical protein [Gloeomargarita sp. SKYGB_i_bin116]